MKPRPTVGSAPHERPTAAIRSAAPSDLNTLCRIERLCFGAEAFPRRVLLHLITKAHGATLVAERDGQIAGYISVLLRTNTCNARIYSVAIDPAYQGYGIGRMLVNEARLFATSNSRTRLTLEVRCDNTSAITLYERVGFQPTERLPGYYHDADGWRMQLEI